jgi:hypothetical protein
VTPGVFAGQHPVKIVALQKYQVLEQPRTWPRRISASRIPTLSASMSAAEFLHQNKEFGRVAVWLRADLVLLDAQSF